VLDAAGTKWNFLRFTPGLVGGHCIGVDPYYLTTKAQELGYLPEVILAGRRINNNVGPFIAEKCVKLLSSGSLPLKETKVGVLGLTFKENVPDLRNSKIPDIVTELTNYGITAMVHDPLGDRGRGQARVRHHAVVARRLPRSRRADLRGEPRRVREPDRGPARPHQAGRRGDRREERARSQGDPPHLRYWSL
jgi:UDP-N-acetyl-D-mannosaminuronate dehydrogenase